MNVSDEFEIILVAIAAWRTFNLIAFDKVLNQPRQWLVKLGWDWKEGDEIPEQYKLDWAYFLTCPYCAGFWISFVWWVAWLIAPHPVAIFAVLFFFATTVVALAKPLTPED